MSDNHTSQIIEQPEDNTPLPSAYDILVETGKILLDAEGAKYVDFFNKLLIQYHNSTLNPKKLELYHFSKVFVVEESFFPPPNDPNIALPSRLSLLQYCIERNGKKANFSVELATKSPATFMWEVAQTFD